MARIQRRRGAEEKKPPKKEEAKKPEVKEEPKKPAKEEPKKPVKAEPQKPTEEKEKPQPKAEAPAPPNPVPDELKEGEKPSPPIEEAVSEAPKTKVSEVKEAEQKKEERVAFTCTQCMEEFSVKDGERATLRCVKCNGTILRFGGFLKTTATDGSIVVVKDQADFNNLRLRNALWVIERNVANYM